jgi:uncharacterized alkaline shock family protein YloU
VPAADLILPLGASGPSSAVTIKAGVISKLAHRAASLTYGVVDLPARPIHKMARILGRPDDAVEVTIVQGRADIDLHVVMERGVNLAQVTANLQQQVRYQLAGVAGLPVGEVRVRVEDLVD